MKLNLLILITIAACLACLPSLAQVPESEPKAKQWSIQTSNVQGVEFFNTIDSGLLKAQLEHKPLLVFMKKESCPHCAKFEGEMLKPNGEFLKASFVCTRILSTSPDAKKMESDFGCHAYPHFIVFREDGSLAGRWYGQPTSAEKFKADAEKHLKSVSVAQME